MNQQGQAPGIGVGLPPIGTDGFRVGDVMQSPINKEVQTRGQWIALDGRDCNRGSYPELSPYFPVGVFTSTARTLGNAPVVPTIAADSVNFMAAGATATAPIQGSPDGITWTAGSGWAASSACASLIVAGPRLVMAGNGGDLVVPFVSATGQAVATAVTKAAWTATAVAGTTALTQGLAYSPQLGLTVMIPDAAGTAIYTLADGAAAWVGRTASSQTKQAICWTGVMFIITTSVAGLLQTSTDGINFNDLYLPETQFSLASIASLGNGIVIVSANNANNNGKIGGMLVSLDGGFTWGYVQLPPDAQRATSTIAYVGTVNVANGMFIITIYDGTTATPWACFTKDGRSFTFDAIGQRGIAATLFKAIAYKAGVYCSITTTTSAFTSIENLSKFRLPHPFLTSTNGAPGHQSAYASYIKSRSN